MCGAMRLTRARRSQLCAAIAVPSPTTEAGTGGGGGGGGSSFRIGAGRAGTVRVAARRMAFSDFWGGGGGGGGGGGSYGSHSGTVGSTYF